MPDFFQYSRPGWQGSDNDIIRYGKNPEADAIAQEAQATRDRELEDYLAQLSDYTYALSTTTAVAVTASQVTLDSTSLLGTATTLQAFAAEVDAVTGRFPRGRMGQASNTALDVTLTGTVADLTSLSVTFTAVSGRRYAVWGHCEINDSVGAASGSLLIRNGSITLQRSVVQIGAAGSVKATVYWESASLSGSITLKLSGIRNIAGGTMKALSGSGSAGADGIAYITVDDVGV